MCLYTAGVLPELKWGLTETAHAPGNDGVTTREH